MTPAATNKRRRFRKEEIVAEATRLFAERGYEGASMGDLAERVGLRKASLFHHFPSKDVLYGKVLDRLLEGVREAVHAAAMSEGSFEARLDNLQDALTNVFGADPHAARLLVRESMDLAGPKKEGLARTIDAVLAASLEFIKAGQRDGVFDPRRDPVQLTVSIVGVHLMPFAVSDVMERFTGTTPFHASFVEERKVAVRDQVRAMVLTKRP